MQNSITGKEVQPANTKAHYWIYHEGKDAWNSWIAVESDSQGTIKNKVINNIEKHCPEGTNFPSVNDEIDFLDTFWEDKADFEGFIFREQAMFQGAVFNKDVEFSNSEFQKRALFAQSIFNGKLSFVNAKILMLISFYQSEFGYVPFINGMSLDGIINFEEVKWPKLPVISSKLDKDKKAFKYMEISNIKAAYCYLKGEMNKRNTHDMERLFFRKELEAKSKLEKTSNREKLLISLYKYSSLYGGSIILPLFWLLIFSIGFMFLYVPYSVGDSIITASQISIANMFPFISPNKFIDTGQISIRCLSDLENICFNIIRGFHIVFSLILISLSLVGLRNKLRLK
jgi:hypothetical protein